MDYNHDLTNSTVNSSPMFGNSYAYAPSPCPEPLYNIRSGTNSLVNLPCCISPQGSSFSNFSPGRRTPDVISSRSLRYHPYHPLPAFAPYPGDIEFRRHATNLFDNDGGKEVNGKWLNSELNGQRNIKIHPTTGNERYDGITTSKTTSRRRKKAIKLSKNKNIYKGNFSAQNIDNYLQTNYYDPNIIPNHVRNRVMLGNVSAQSIDNNLQTNYDHNAVLNNVPNEVMDKNNFSTQSISKHPPTNYNPNVVPSNTPNTPTNYNPNVVPSNTPNTVTSERNFSAQSIDNNPPTNYYDHNTASYHVPSNVMPKGNFTAQRTDNYPHTNYNPNVILNCTEAHTEVSVSNKEANQCNQQCSMANEQNHTDGKYYSHVQVIEGNIDKTKISPVNSTVTEETNFITCADKDTVFNTQPQNDLLQGISASTVQSATDVSDTQSLNSLDLSDYNLTHVTMPENSSFSIEDIRQETLENADLSNYSFEPIFEGKDENGEDMVVLLVNSSAVSSSAQQVDECENGAFADNQNSEILKDPAVLNNVSGNTITLHYIDTLSTPISNETLLEPQVHEVNNEVGENMFFSNIDDYGSEETVTTSKRKYIRTKNSNNKRDKSRDKNVNQISRGNYTTSYATSQPSTSRESANISTNTSHHANTSYKRRKCGNFSYKQPWWRRRHLRYHVTPIRNIQRTFIKKFMRRVRIENEHMMASEKFWNSYRMIVSQIGGSVMQAMYNILPALIRNSEESEQKSNAGGSKTTKNRLQVKFPPKLKKQDNSGK